MEKKTGVKTVLARTAFAISALAALVSCALFVRFLLETGAQTQSFAEAVKQVLRFYTGMLFPTVGLVCGAVFAGVAIACAPSERFKKHSRRLFVAELVLFALLFAVIVTMYIVIEGE